jgi:hypothetical protein
VLGNRRERDVEARRDVSGSELPVPHKPKDLPTAGLRYNLQCVQSLFPLCASFPVDGVLPA